MRCIAMCFVLLFKQNLPRFLQALAYFEQLKISQDAWQVCAEALAQSIYR